MESENAFIRCHVSSEPAAGVFHGWQYTGVLQPVGKHPNGHLMTHPASFLYPVFPRWVAAYIKNANLVSILPLMMGFNVLLC